MEYVEKRDLILKYIKLYRIDDDIKITEEMLENMITYMDYILEKNKYINLLKYEMKKSKVPMILVLAVTLILEVLFLIGLLVTDKQQLTEYAIVMLTLFAPFSILVSSLFCVFTLNQELTSTTGYMLFMTPNSSKKILGAKVLHSIIIVLCGVIFFSIVATIDLGILSAKYPELKEALNQFPLIQIHYDEIANLLFNTGISWLSILSYAFLSVVLQASVLRGKKGSLILSIIIFIGLNILFGIISSYIPWPSAVLAKSIAQAVWNIVIIVGFYFLSSWLMENKLNM